MSKLTSGVHNNQSSNGNLCENTESDVDISV